MRTVTFQSVYEGVLRRLGLDPLGDAVTQDTARTIAGKIQKRARLALRSWNFLEWSHTEERAFRSVWNSTRQFYKVNPVTGKADELFYIPEAKYYKVYSSAVSDPPVGTLPTDTDYFVELTPVDTYIALDETCRHSIGQMLGVYPRNPRLNGCGQRGLNFRPSEMGIDVCAPCGPTVFIHYMLPEPAYTKVPYIPLKTYNQGDRVFQPADGNVYRCRAQTTNNAPPNATYWILEPVLEVLANYLEAGAYADCLKMSGSGVDKEERTQLMQLAEAEAATYLEQEIDSLQAQGQTNYYNIYQRRRIWGYWWASQPWSGGSVSELTDACEADFIFPPAPLAPSGLFIYAPEIKSLSGTAPALNTYTTTNLKVDTMIEIYTGQEARLDAGPADPDDPGQVVPLDYNVVSNNKHWTEVM